MQNKYRTGRYGLFLVVNPPEKNLIEDPFFNGEAVQNYGRGGVRESDHVYAFPDVSLDIKRLRSKLARPDTDCILYFNNQTVPENNEIILALKDELAVGVRERRVVAVVCRCAWNWVGRIGEIVKPFPDKEGVVISNPRVDIQKKLAPYGLADAEVWAQLPRMDRLTPAKYQQMAEGAKASYEKLPYCWHGARAIMNQWFQWCGWLEGALKTRCGQLE